MINKRKWSVGFALVAALGATACDNGLTDVNRNPNNPTDAPAGPLFTNAVRVAVSRFLGSGYDQRQLSLVAQHLAEVQYPESDQYIRLGAGFTTGTFDGAYSSELKDLEQVRQKGLTLEDAGIWAPADIMEQWVFGYLTDTWGDIPYSAALQGDLEGGSIQPAYDPQEQVYAGMFTRLEAATAALDDADASLAGADPIYGGDPVQWQKFSNSIHARQALRAVNVDQALASAELQAAFSASGGLIEDNADNAVFYWPGDGVFDNPWAVNFKTRDDHRISKTLMDVLLATNDPRTPVYAQPAQDGSGFVGLQNALTHAQASAFLTTTSRPGLVLYPPVTSYDAFPGAPGLSAPSFLMTAAEVNFIKAEAAERSLGGLTPAEAQGYYEAGIRASMEQWGVGGAANAYIAQASVSYTAAGSQVERLRRIALQKWIALFTDGAQAWAEWRRTCVPNTLRPGPSAIEDEVIRRYQYSTTETSVNADNVNAAIANMGADDFLTRMWWDSNPTAAPTYVAGCGTKP
jgi:hypothetical protein